MTKSQQTLTAERKLRDILDAIHYDTTSLTHALVKAYRSGMNGDSGIAAYALLGQALKESEDAYKAAIAQPENKIAARPQVNL